MAAFDIRQDFSDLVKAEIDAQCLGEDYFFHVSAGVAIAPPSNGLRLNVIIGRAAPSQLIGHPPLLYGIRLQDLREATPQMAHDLVADALDKLASLVRELLSIPGKPTHTPGR